MPLPLLAWAAIATGTAIVGGVYAYATMSGEKADATRSEKRAEDKIMSFIGPRMVGKSTLANFLETGELKHDLPQNVSTSTRSAGTWEYKDGEANFVSFDEVGSQDAYISWKTSFDKSNFVFYLFNILDLLDKSKESEKRIVDDFYQIRSWVKEKPKKVVLVLTHADKIIDGEGSSASWSADIFDSINNLDAVKKIKDLMPTTYFGIVVGSLADVESARSLASRAIEEAADG